MTDWYLYIVRCLDESLYTGITCNVERRIKEHNSGRGKASRYTRGRRPVCLIYQERYKSRSEASVREYQIKQMSHHEKENLILYYSGSLDI